MGVSYSFRQALLYSSYRHGYIAEFTCKSLATSKTHWCLVYHGCVIRGTTCIATIIHLNFRLTEKHIYQQIKYPSGYMLRGGGINNHAVSISPAMAL